MSKLKLTGKQIRAIGYEEGPVISVAMHTMGTHFKHHTIEEALQILKEVLASPPFTETLWLEYLALLPKTSFCQLTAGVFL